MPARTRPLRCLARRRCTAKVDPQGADKTTGYQYFTDPIADGTNYGRIKQIVRDRGAWSRREYNPAGQLSKEISGFLNAAPGAPENACRVREYDYTPVDSADLRTLDP